MDKLVRKFWFIEITGTLNKPGKRAMTDQMNNWILLYPENSTCLFFNISSQVFRILYHVNAFFPTTALFPFTSWRWVALFQRHKHTNTDCIRGHWKRNNYETGQESVRANIRVVCPWFWLGRTALFLNPSITIIKLLPIESKFAIHVNLSFFFSRN